MKGHSVWNLRSRLLLLVALSLVPALALVVYAGVERRAYERDLALKDALVLARIAALEQDRAVEGARQLLLALAHLPQVRLPNAAGCGAFLAALRLQYPRYANIGVALPNGDVVCSAVPLVEPVNIADRAYFRRALQTRSFGVGEYQVGRLTGRPSINFGYPVLESARGLYGVVFVAVDLEWLGTLVADARLPEGTTLMIVDSTGTVLARHPDAAKWVGQSVPYAPVVQAMLAQRREGTTEAAGVDGVRRLYAFTAVGNPGHEGAAYVAVGIPTEVAFATANRVMARNLIALALIALLALGAAWVGGDVFVLRQVNALVAATRRLGAGDLGARSGLPHRGGELNELARAFDETAAALQAHVAQAEQTADALRRYAERLSLLRRIDQAILIAESPADIARAALAILRPLIQCQRASVVVFDVDSGEAESLAADVNGTAHLGPGTRLPPGTVRLLDRLQQGEVSVIEDLQALPDPSAPMRALMAEGVRSYTMVPIVSEGRLIGSLNLGLDRPGALQADRLEMAREVADQVGIAIEQARLREALRHYAADLEQRVAERTAALELARAEADRANQAKSEFLSRMSHELRTPLNAILGFAQLLEMDSLSPEQREGVAHILKAGRHLLDLINEVLDIARIEAGRIALSPEPVRVREVLAEAFALVQPLAAEWNGSCTLVPPRCDGDPFVLADRQRLKQVLLNLFANAVKYNREGGSVTATCKVVPERLRISVVDTGPGIAPEQIPHLFVPFNRLEADGTGVEGTGLGLALSRRLVEAMGGAIGVESTPGEGSTFWIELPLAQGAAAPTEAKAIADGQPPGPETDAPAVVRTILYIEDNLSNVNLIERVLARRRGVRLLTAMQGGLGLDLAREHHPDLILLDLHLPDLPGDEVLRRLQSAAATREIPVVVISADATRGQRERLLSAGAQAYLAKPIDIRQLLEVVDAMVQAPVG